MTETSSIYHKDNYLKSMKNGLTILSCISFLLNILQAVELTPIFYITLMYFPSNALAFYSSNPKAESSKKRRKFIVNMSIYAPMLLAAAGMITSSFTISAVFMVYFVKLVLGFASVFIPIFSYLDDTDNETTSEKEMRVRVKNDIKKGKEKALYKTRDNKVVHDRELKEYIAKKEPK